jgi:moderate conductance mechanosensitive channel
MSNIEHLAMSLGHLWDGFWDSGVGHWLATKGLHITIVVTLAVLLARAIRAIASRVSRKLDDKSPADAIVYSEYVKHRKAVASVISSCAIAIVATVVSLDVLTQIGIPIASLAAPAAVMGAAIGFGAQRIVQDVLAGFFVIIEKQYGFGDLVQLTISGSSKEAMGTVEDVTLRVTKLRNTDGEVSTIPNGQIVKSHNLSKDWARAVVDVPVSTSADIAQVSEMLHDVTTMAMRDSNLPTLLLDEPSVMGVESLEMERVNLRLVARTLPGKQFEVSRRLRAMVVTKLRRAGVDTTPTDASERPKAG